MKRAVFLDRDGVINQTLFRDGKPRAPDRVEDFHFFPGVENAVLTLKNAGFLIIVVTNQPDVARGWQKREIVEAMNQIVRDQLGVDAIRVCYHTEKDGCACRKPKPGMLTDAAREFGISLPHSFMVGDRLGDIAAGNAAGCTSILVGQGDLDSCGASEKEAAPATQVQSLEEAAKWILARPAPM